MENVIKSRSVNGAALTTIADENEKINQINLFINETTPEAYDLVKVVSQFLDDEPVKRVFVQIQGAGGLVEYAKYMAEELSEIRSRCHQVNVKYTIATAFLSSAGIYYMPVVDNKVFIYASHARTVGDDKIVSKDFAAYNREMELVDQNNSSLDYKYVLVARGHIDLFNDHLLETATKDGFGHIDHVLLDTPTGNWFLATVFEASKAIEEHAEVLEAYEEYKYTSAVDRFAKIKAKAHLADEFLDLSYIVLSEMKTLSFCRDAFEEGQLRSRLGQVVCYPEIREIMREFNKGKVGYIERWFAKQASRNRFLPMFSATQYGDFLFNEISDMFSDDFGTQQKQTPIRQFE